MKFTRDIKKTTIVFALVCLVLLGTSCSKTKSSTEVSNDTTTTDSLSSKVESSSIKPKGPKPDWAPNIHPEMQAVIEKLESYQARPIETLSAAEARKNPTPTTAVMDLISENNITVPKPAVDTVGKNIPVKGGNIHIRIYTPQKKKDIYPIILYIHGGGWVIADIDTYDASSAGLSEQAEAVVISVDYRQGPEHKFPTAHNDCFAAYQWALSNASTFMGDTSNIAVVGESAGGNMAANVTIMAIQKRIKVPVSQVLVYPVAQGNLNTESYQKNANAKPLNKAMISWFLKNFLPSMASAKDPRMDLTKANLKGLPPTTIITAEYDPLQSDGQILRDKLKEANVEVTYENYDGVTHEFFGMAAIVPEAKKAQELAVKELKKHF